MLPVVVAGAIIAAKVAGGAATSSNTSLLITIYNLGGIVVALGVVGAFFRWLWKSVRPAWQAFKHFLDDWHGEAPRPGSPGTPGVMLRIQNVEDTVKFLKAEVSPNHGNSLKD